MIAVIFHLPLLLLKTQNKIEIGKEVIEVKIISNQVIKEKPYQKSTYERFNQSLLSSLSNGYVKDIDFKNAGTKKSKLYDYIEEGLTFPESFQKFNVSGAVSSRLYFNNRGEFDITMSSFNSKNGFLRYHVMTYLERKLKGFKLGDDFSEGFVDASFIFKFKVSGLNFPKTYGKDQFIFERTGFKAATGPAQALLEVGQTLISLLNLLKFRPDFLKSNSELSSEQRALFRFQQIRQHPYYL